MTPTRLRAPSPSSTLARCLASLLAVRLSSLQEISIGSFSHKFLCMPARVPVARTINILMLQTCYVKSLLSGSWQVRMHDVSTYLAIAQSNRLARCSCQVPWRAPCCVAGSEDMASVFRQKCRLGNAECGLKLMTPCSAWTDTLGPTLRSKWWALPVNGNGPPM